MQFQGLRKYWQQDQGVPDLLSGPGSVRLTERQVDGMPKELGERPMPAREFDDHSSRGVWLLASYAGVTGRKEASHS